MTDWTVSVSRDIAADATTLYELVTDVPRMGEWSPENHTCIWKEGFDRAVVGAQWTGDNKNGEVEWQTEAEVTEANPGQVFAFDAKAGDFVFSKWRYDFEPIEGGTRVTESWLDLRPDEIREMSEAFTGSADRDATNRANIEATLAALAAATES